MNVSVIATVCKTLGYYTIKYARAGVVTDDVDVVGAMDETRAFVRINGVYVDGADRLVAALAMAMAVATTRRCLTPHISQSS